MTRGERITLSYSIGAPRKFVAGKAENARLGFGVMHALKKPYMILLKHLSCELDFNVTENRRYQQQSFNSH